MRRGAEPAPRCARGSPWRRHRWLLARRACQLLILGLFLLGPWAGIWLARGNLASSRWFGVLPLTDPFVALQALLAGHGLATGAMCGAALVAVGYAALGGRSYCA